jgi:hypothetical protein
LDSEATRSRYYFFTKTFFKGLIHQFYSRRGSKFERAKNISQYCAKMIRQLFRQIFISGYWMPITVPVTYFFPFKFVSVRGARKLTGDNLKVVWPEFSTLS